MKELPRLYITQPVGYEMRCEAIVMEVLFLLVNHFARPLLENTDVRDLRVRERLNDIVAYVQAHYKEDITLGDLGRPFWSEQRVLLPIF